MWHERNFLEKKMLTKLPGIIRNWLHCLAKRPVSISPNLYSTVDEKTSYTRRRVIYKPIKVTATQARRQRDRFPPLTCKETQWQVYFSFAEEGAFFSPLIRTNILPCRNFSYPPLITRIQTFSTVYMTNLLITGSEMKTTNCLKRLASFLSQGHVHLEIAFWKKENEQNMTSCSSLARKEDTSRDSPQLEFPFGKLSKRGGVTTNVLIKKRERMAGNFLANSRRLIKNEDDVLYMV